MDSLYPLPLNPSPQGREIELTLAPHFASRITTPVPLPSWERLAMLNAAFGGP